MLFCTRCPQTVFGHGETAPHGESRYFFSLSYAARYYYTRAKGLLFQTLLSPLLPAFHAHFTQYQFLHIWHISTFLTKILISVPQKRWKFFSGKENFLLLELQKLSSLTQIYFAPGVLRQFLAMKKQHRMENPGIFFTFLCCSLLLIRALRVSSSKLSWVPYFQLSMHTSHNVSFCKFNTNITLLLISVPGRKERWKLLTGTEKFLSLYFNHFPSLWWKIFPYFSFHESKYFFTFI